MEEEQIPSESRQTSKNDFASIAPKSPATQAIQQALKKLPPKPDASGVESEVAIFQRLLHDFNQEYNVNQSEIDRETIASLSELQTRFLIESDVAGQSAQLYAQIELHHDFVAKFLWTALKKKSLDQRQCASNTLDKVSEMLQDCLDRQTLEFRKHTKWLKGVCDAKVEAARQAGNNSGHNVQKKCELLFAKQLKSLKQDHRNKMENLFSQIKEKNDEIEALKTKSKSRSDTLTKLLNEQKAEVKTLMKEKAKLQYRFETEGQELIQMENKLKSANDIIRQKALSEEKLGIQIADLKNQNKSVRSDLREANVLYEELLKERDELQLKCNEIENALAENADAANGLEKRIAQAKELDRIHKEEVLGLKQANEDLSKQLKRAKSRVEDISKSKENMIAKKKKMEKEYQALADEMVQCRGEVVQLNMTVQGLEQELNQEKLKHIEHHEKKHEHSSGIFNKVK